MAYGYKLYDPDWARSLDLPPRKETAHWSRGCLCVDLVALRDELTQQKLIIQYVDFKRVLVWVVMNPGDDESSGGNGKQNTPLPKFVRGSSLMIPLSKFWEKSMVTHVRQPDKYDASIAALFDEFEISEREVFLKAVNSLLDKLDELKATDVHYLEVLPFSSAFDIDQYNDAVINIFTRLNSAGRVLLPQVITFAWIKTYWKKGEENSNRLADESFDELAEQLKAKANLSLDTDELVRGMSAVWATLFSNGDRLKESDFLKGEKLKPMAIQLAKCWNTVATSVLSVSEQISGRSFEYGKTYFSLKALFVLWGLERVKNMWDGYRRLSDPQAFNFDGNTRR